MTFRLHYVQLKAFLLSISTKECDCQSAISNLLIDDKMFVPLLCAASTIFMYLRTLNTIFLSLLIHMKYNSSISNGKTMEPKLIHYHVRMCDLI